MAPPIRNDLRTPVDSAESELVAADKLKIDEAVAEYNTCLGEKAEPTSPIIEQLETLVDVAQSVVAEKAEAKKEATESWKQAKEELRIAKAALKAGKSAI